MNRKLEIVTRGQGKQRWYFRIKAANGKILCHSETYCRFHNCLHALELAAQPRENEVVREIT